MTWQLLCRCPSPKIVLKLHSSFFGHLEEELQIKLKVTGLTQCGLDVPNTLTIVCLHIQQTQSDIII